jgi:hypothetical protein
MQTACSDHDQSTPPYLTGPSVAVAVVLLSLVEAGSCRSIAVLVPVVAGGRPGEARLPVGR